MYSIFRCVGRGGGENHILFRGTGYPGTKVHVQFELIQATADAIKYTSDNGSLLGVVGYADDRRLRAHGGTVCIGRKVLTSVVAVREEVAAAEEASGEPYLRSAYVHLYSNELRRNYSQSVGKKGAGLLDTSTTGVCKVRIHHEN